MDDLTCALLSLAKQAGKAILSHYQTGEPYRIKSDQSPVTAADMQADQLLQAGLQCLTPNIPILSEESEAIMMRAQLSPAQYWLIDPLDGTREFIAGTDEFTVNIALMEQDQAVRGVVYAPVLQWAYFAVQGQGAYKQQVDEHPVRIQTRRRVADTPLKITLSRHHHVDEKLARFLRTTEIADENIHLAPHGSALKFGLVAEGMMDIYPRFGTTAIWDTAAGQCILEAAGGQLLGEQGSPLRYPLDATLKNPSFLAVGDADYPWSEHWRQFLSVEDKC